MSEPAELLVSDFVMSYYVNSEGVYLGGWDADPPEGAIKVPNNPILWDQIWSFETSTWSESPSLNVLRENQWRAEQMLRIANQLLMIEDGDPDAEPGSARQWRDYRIALRGWAAESPDFPDNGKRPVAPS